jgi:hypothetical protein
MFKCLTAIALGSALLLAPALAQADESTTPPTPNSVKTPGNGPTVSGGVWSGPSYSPYANMMPGPAAAQPAVPVVAEGYPMQEGRSAYIENGPGYELRPDMLPPEDTTYYSRGR